MRSRYSLAQLRSIQRSCTARDNFKAYKRIEDYFNNNLVNDYKNVDDFISKMKDKYNYCTTSYCILENSLIKRGELCYVK